MSKKSVGETQVDPKDSMVPVRRVDSDAARVAV